jgi:hypothetical protein
MTGSASSISACVLAAYRSSREAGADEWTACDEALQAFCRAHPEASSDFANTFVSEVLREAYPPARIKRLPPASLQRAAGPVRTAAAAYRAAGSGSHP